MIRVVFVEPQEGEEQRCRLEVLDDSGAVKTALAIVESKRDWHLRFEVEVGSC